MSRAAPLLLALAALVPAACAAGPGGAGARPPSPRLDERGTGRDPLDEPRPGTSLRDAPAPPLVTPESPGAGTGLPSPPDAEPTLYVIGDRAITTADLGDFVLRYFPDRAREPLGQLVDEALVRHFAGVEGVDVGDDLVQARAAAYIEERRREVRVQYGAEATLEQVLTDSLGRSLAEFERDARRLARVALLRDRLVRLDQRREDRVEVRALTLPDEVGARDAVAALRGGADLTLLARRLGLRPPAAPPPLARSDIHPEVRAEEVFGAGAGAVLDPRSFEAPDGTTWWEVVKVVASWEADSRPWAALRDEVLASIDARPVGVPEYLAWRRRALARAGVDVQRGGRGLVPWLESR